MRNHNYPQRMVKFNKKVSKEYDAIGRTLKPVSYVLCLFIIIKLNLQRFFNSRMDLKLLRAKSSELVSAVCACCRIIIKSITQNHFFTNSPPQMCQL